MELLGIPPGPRGRRGVLGYLLELRLDHGPMSEDAAKAALLEWWGSRRLTRRDAGYWLPSGPAGSSQIPASRRYAGGRAGCRGSRGADPAASAGAGGRPARRPGSIRSRTRGTSARSRRTTSTICRPTPWKRSARPRSSWCWVAARWPAPANSPATPRLTSRRSGMPTNPPSRSSHLPVDHRVGPPDVPDPEEAEVDLGTRPGVLAGVAAGLRSRRRTSRYQLPGPAVAAHAACRFAGVASRAPTTLC